MVRILACRIRLQWVQDCSRCVPKGEKVLAAAFNCCLVGERIVILHVIIKKTEKDTGA
jgi:hypothetical protein